MLTPEDFKANFSFYQKKTVYFVYLKKFRSSLKYPERTFPRFLQCSVNTFTTLLLQSSLIISSLLYQNLGNKGLTAIRELNAQFTKHQLSKQQKQQLLSSSARFFGTHVFPSFSLVWHPYVFKMIKPPEMWNLLQVHNARRSFCT